MKESFFSETVLKKLHDFAKTIKGTVLFKDHPEYDNYRNIWNLVIDAHPSCVIRVKDAQDVAAVLAFSKENRIPLVVRGVGHSLAGYSAGHDCLVIDLSALNRIDLDEESRIARIEPGATWGEVAEALQPYGLAITSGDNAGVGVGGLTQGSGMGFMVRKYGLTIDLLRSVELVTAEGSILHASQTENADLFWAIRGGAGNFGIVTALELEVHGGGELLGGFLFYEGANASELLEIGQLAAKAPEELTTIISIMTAPNFPFIPSAHHGKPILRVFFCYTGDLKEGEKVLAPFREIGTVIADSVGPKPYVDLIQNLGKQRFGYISRNLYLQSLNLQTAEALVKDIHEIQFPSFMGIQLRVLGGAMSRIPVDTTAFPHRDKPFFVWIQNLYMTKEQEEENRVLNHRVWKTLLPFAAGADVNFLGITEKDRLHDVYPAETLERLIQLKKQYDPENMFKSNLNICAD
ncbi:FAD-binding oxidoreductase [Paenibacillus agri]|uniref:FAD-binding oxidoreductase n=1 Tax=Paenibacillus agri TaxID=2744309 RepID=A0A850EY23_9BACL|nr:FAD-binding oxidoreductase [Paenibacillus agri]NUU64494.1 FAD-binding oxidoreductase [Paenibacillus agri]